MFRYLFVDFLLRVHNIERLKVNFNYTSLKSFDVNYY